MYEGQEHPRQSKGNPRRRTTSSTRDQEGYSDKTKTVWCWYRNRQTEQNPERGLQVHKDLNIYTSGS